MRLLIIIVMLLQVMKLLPVMRQSEANLLTLKQETCISIVSLLLGISRSRTS